MKPIASFMLLLVVSGCCHKLVEVKLEDAIIASRNALFIAQNRILFQEYVKYKEYSNSMGGDYYKISTVKLNGTNLVVTSSEWDPSLTGTYSATPSIGFTLGGKFSKIKL